MRPEDITDDTPIEQILSEDIRRQLGPGCVSVSIDVFPTFWNAHIHQQDENYQKMASGYRSGETPGQAFRLALVMFRAEQAQYEAA